MGRSAAKSQGNVRKFYIAWRMVTLFTIVNAACKFEMMKLKIVNTRVNLHRHNGY